MMAMRLEKPQDIASEPLKARETAVSEPDPNQICLRVHVCGVCHTDLHTVEGELTLPRLPLTPGHQIVGTVVAQGSNATRYEIGERVGVGWLNWTCGVCDFCTQRLENLCPEARFTGLHADGGYAEAALIDERFAYPLPERFSDVEAAPLLCAGIIGFRALRLSNIHKGGRLGLYGFGASAHLAIQVARHWGCTVSVFTRSADHKRHAEALGAAWVGEAQEQPPQPLDAAVTFAPAGWIVPHALGHLRPGGTLAINAIHMSPIPELAYDKIYHERVLRSVKNFTRQDAEDFLQIAAQIPIRTDVEVFPLEGANRVLKRLKASEIRGAAVLQVSNR